MSTNNYMEFENTNQVKRLIKPYQNKNLYKSAEWLDIKYDKNNLVDRAILLLDGELVLKFGKAKEIENEYNMHKQIYNEISKENKQFIAPIHPSIEGLNYSGKLRFYGIGYIPQSQSLSEFLTKLDTNPFKYSPSTGNMEKKNNNQLEKVKQNKQKLNKIKDQLLRVFKNIWQLGYIHGDLHLGNILVDKNQNIKVIDFGNTRKLIKTKALTNSNNMKKWFQEAWNEYLLITNLNLANPNGWIAGWNIPMFADKHLINRQYIQPLFKNK